MCQRSNYHKNFHRSAMEKQLKAEEAWMVEALKMIKKQRNALLVEKLHLQALQQQCAEEARREGRARDPTGAAGAAGSAAASGVSGSVGATFAAGASGVTGSVGAAFAAGASTAFSEDTTTGSASLASGDSSTNKTGDAKSAGKQSAGRGSARRNKKRGPKQETAPDTSLIINMMSLARGEKDQSNMKDETACNKFELDLDSFLAAASANISMPSEDKKEVKSNEDLNQDDIAVEINMLMNLTNGPDE